jgi:hypothetical protein
MSWWKRKGAKHLSPVPDFLSWSSMKLPCP